MARNLGGIDVIRKTRIYPLDHAADPPEMRFVMGDGVGHNTVHSNDFSFYEEVDEIVQEEPVHPDLPTRRDRAVRLISIVAA